MVGLYNDLSRAKFGRLTRHIADPNMSDTTNIHQAGIQINFRSWERFNLESIKNDGVVLFQYLVFHCQSIPEWTHSDNDIRFELGIKRSRLTDLRTDIFADFLHTRIVKDRNSNDIRAYRIDFAKLATLPVLRKVYREVDHNGEPYDLAEYAKVFKAIAAAQPKLGAQKDKAEQAKQTSIKLFAQLLKETFDSRREDHNTKQQKAGKRLATGTIHFSPDSLRKLQNAANSIGDREYIRQAFIVLCDALNYSASQIEHSGYNELMPNTPKSPLRYFLSFTKGDLDEQSNFGVIQSFGDYYASHYGRG